MTDYFSIATGFDNAGAVAPFTPYQPLTEGLQFTKITPTASDVVTDAPFITFKWGQMKEAEFVALMTSAGLSFLVRKAPVTIYAQDEDWNWTYFNGTAIRPPNKGRNGYWLTNIQLTVINLYLAEEP